MSRRGEAVSLLGVHRDAGTRQPSSDPVLAPPTEREVTPDWKPAKTRRGGKDRRRIRAAVEKRTGGRCEARVSPNCRGVGTHIHHRKLRAQGGDNKQENLLAVCDQCHGLIHASPAVSYARGLLVHSFQDPASVPVRAGVDCCVCDDLGCEFCPAVDVVGAGGPSRVPAVEPPRVCIRGGGLTIQDAGSPNEASAHAYSRSESIDPKEAA